MLDHGSEDLLKKALQLFLLYGYRKTTMNDVAVAGAVSRQTLYSRYDNKEALHDALIETISRQAFERGLAELSAGRPVWQAVAAALFHWLGKAIDDLNVRPHGSEIAAAWRARPGPKGEVRGYDLQIGAALAEFLHRAEALGEIDLGAPGLTAPDVAETLILGACGIGEASRSSDDFARRVEILVRVYAGATEAGG